MKTAKRMEKSAMAIKTLTTIKATIQMRHGLEIDFDADQMAAGEWAVSTDKKYVRMCFAPGIVIRMATYEAFEQDMLEIQTILATCEDILAAVEAMANLAEQHKNAASASAYIASAKADDAANSAAAANTSASAADASKTEAASSASTASAKAREAATSETNAANSASTATQKANAAGESATNAANSASTATSKANAASASATSASNSATSADAYAKKAQSYAIGTGGVRPNESTDNAKYYYEQSKNISQGLGGTLLPMGTVSFANLPALSNAESGWMYNVFDQFTTTSDFNEGAGKVIPAGSNVYKTADGKWDVLAGTPVTTVNGQTGNVVLNKVDVGLGNVPNVTTNNQTPTFTQATTRGNISSGDKLSVIFGKIMKWFSDLKNVAFTGSYNDLSNKPSIPSITNDYLATQPGTAADAMLAKELRGDIDAINSKLGKAGKIISSSIVQTTAARGVETIIGEITLDSGVWIILMNVWNPLGMAAASLGVRETGHSALATWHLMQNLSFATHKSKTTYHVLYTQWSEETVTVVNGEIYAIQIA